MDCLTFRRIQSIIHETSIAVTIITYITVITATQSWECYYYKYTSDILI